MKTSNVLLTISGLLILAVLIGATLSLKAEYEKGDFSDKFYHYNLQPLEQINELVIDAPRGVRVEIQRADSGRLAYPEKWETAVSVTTDQGTATLTVAEDVPNNGEKIYVLSPDLPSVRLLNGPSANCSGFRARSFELHAAGYSRITMQEMRIDTIRLTGANESFFSIKNCDTISLLDLRLADNTRFRIARTTVDTIAAQLGPQVQMEFQGTAFSDFGGRQASAGLRYNDAENISKVIVGGN